MPQPNMNQMMKQVQQMQAEMVKAQEEAQKQVVEASAGGGMVTVKVNGALEVLEIRIDPERGRPGRRRDAAGHGPGRHQRGPALGPGDGRQPDERRSRAASRALWAGSACPVCSAGGAPFRAPARARVPMQPR